MKRLGVVLFALLAIAAAEPKKGERVTGKVVKVADGDTLTLRVEKTDYVIRLSGIDAPEDGQDFAKVARQALVQRVIGKQVRVLIRDKDKYGRLVGVVYLDGDCVNTKLVAQGLAWHYVEYESSKVLAHAESEARENELGLWADAHPMPPWEWREQRAKEVAAKAVAERAREAKADSDRTELAAEARARERSQAGTAVGSYWLNTASNVRHNSSCRYFQNTKKGRACGPNDGRACGICGG